VSGEHLRPEDPLQSYIAGLALPRDTDIPSIPEGKTDPALLATIDDGLMQLMKDPYWQGLKQKYGMA
jgi:hypothetical protein